MEGYSFSQAFDSAGFQAATILVCICCLYFTLSNKRGGRIHSEIYMMMVINVGITAVCSLVGVLVKPFMTERTLFMYMSYVSQYIYFLLHPILAPMFCFYVAIITGAIRNLKRSMRFVYQGPMYALILIALTNPVTRWIYYFDENLEYQRGPGIYFMYIASTL
ncbi:MAG: hypothetical protein J5842_06155, partial [Lachnospiraceae bacterium]|nr:hypothetical protein [Lachnospiraceae bacterium]